MYVVPQHPRPKIDFVIVTSDLRPYVMDTRVKRGAELSTDHHLVVSWVLRLKKEAFRDMLSRKASGGSCKELTGPKGCGFCWEKGKAAGVGKFR